MKLVVLSVVGALAALSFQDPQAPAASAKTAAQDPAPDPDLMQVYQLGLFVPGDRHDEASKVSKDEMAEMQRGHLANITAMARAGKVVLAGPFLDHPKPDSPRGLLLFDVQTKEEVEALMKSDPFVSHGILKLELTRWYGPKHITSVWNEQEQKRKQAEKEADKER